MSEETEAEQRLDWLSSQLIVDAVRVLRVRMTPERVAVMYRWMDEEWAEERADHGDDEVDWGVRRAGDDFVVLYESRPDAEQWLHEGDALMRRAARWAPWMLWAGE